RRRSRRSFARRRWTTTKTILGPTLLRGTPLSPTLLRRQSESGRVRRRRSVAGSAVPRGSVGPRKDFILLHHRSAAMPTYQYEAMDTTGGEVKDTVDAGSEEEAQQKIRQLGYFVTRLTEVAKGKKKDKKKGAQQEKRKKTKVLTLGGVKMKHLVM